MTFPLMQHYRLLGFFSMLGLISLLACGSNEEGKTPSVKQAKTVDVSGDVFIVTKSAESIRLGLVLVTAYPESVIVAHLKARREEQRVASAKLDPEISAARDRMLAAGRIAALEQRKLDKMPLLALNADEAAWKVRNAQQERFNQAAREQEQERRTMNNLQAQRAYLGSAPFFFDGLPLSHLSTKTDADGRFSMAVPDGVPFVLIAQASRQVFDQAEHYYWMIRSSETSGQGGRIFLSNDNLVTTPSEQSVLFAPE